MGQMKIENSVLIGTVPTICSNVSHSAYYQRMSVMDVGREGIVLVRMKIQKCVNNGTAVKDIINVLMVNNVYGSRVFVVAGLTVQIEVMKIQSFVLAGNVQDAFGNVKIILHVLGDQKYAIKKQIAQMVVMKVKVSVWGGHAGMSLLGQQCESVRIM